MNCELRFSDFLLISPVFVSCSSGFVLFCFVRCALWWMLQRIPGRTDCGIRRHCAQTAIVYVIRWINNKTKKMVCTVAATGHWCVGLESNRIESIDIVRSVFLLLASVQYWMGFYHCARVCAARRCRIHVSSATHCVRIHFARYYRATDCSSKLNEIAS